jgi:hypothetical protein
VVQKPKIKIFRVNINQTKYIKDGWKTSENKNLLHKSPIELEETDVIVTKEKIEIIRARILLMKLAINRYNRGEYILSCIESWMHFMVYGISSGGVSLWMLISVWKID